MRKNLAEVVASGVSGRPARNPGAGYAFTSGIQEAWSAVAAAGLAGICKTGNVPAGLTARFVRALASPTLGGLRDFALWLFSGDAARVLPDTAAALALERSGKALLSRLVELRNESEHPKERPPEVVLREAEALLAVSPSTIPEAWLETGIDGAAYWRLGHDEIALGPFAASDENGLTLFRSFTPPATLDIPGGGASFGGIWRNWRVNDLALESPTAEEVREKAELALPRQVAADASMKSPWWLDSLLAAGPVGLLASPDAGRRLVFGSRSVWNRATVVDLPVVEGKGALEGLSTSLGLAYAPRPIDLAALSVSAQPLVLVARTETLPPKAFVDALYLLADLRDAKATSLRFVLQRDAATLADDSRRLADRLPDHLDGLLRRPPHTRVTALHGYLWPESRRRILGMF